VVSITWSYVPLDLILPDQPNRAVRTRMLRGVGGTLSEGRPYPDGRSRYAAGKKSKIVYNSYACPISGTFKKGIP